MNEEVHLGRASKLLVPRVVNVVATADLRQRVDLVRIGGMVGGSHDPKIYACAYLSVSPMRGRVSVFSTGKLISVGTKSPEAARADLGYAAKALELEGVARRVRPEVTIRNIVLALDLGEILDLPVLSVELEESVYEPEIFPGLAWKPGDFPGHFLLFNSGKVVASVKTMADARRVRKYLRSRVLHHYN